MSTPLADLDIVLLLLPQPLFCTVICSDKQGTVGKLHDVVKRGFALSRNHHQVCFHLSSSMANRPPQTTYKLSNAFPAKAFRDFYKFQARNAEATIQALKRDLEMEIQKFSLIKSSVVGEDVAGTKGKGGGGRQSGQAKGKKEKVRSKLWLQAHHK